MEAPEFGWTSTSPSGHVTYIDGASSGRQFLVQKENGKTGAKNFAKIFINQIDRSQVTFSYAYQSQEDNRKLN